MSFLWFLVSIRNPILNALMMAASYIGTPFAIVGFIIWFYYNVDKKIAACMNFSFYLGGLTCQSLKIIFHIPRPWLRDPSFQAVAEAVPSANGYSFPSIHTQSSTAFFTAVIFFIHSKTVRALSAVGLAIIIFSRMYLGCHTPMDVSVAFGISLAFTVIICIVMTHTANENRIVNFILALIAVMAAGTMILDLVLLRNGTIDAYNAKDALSTTGIALGFLAGSLIERKYVNFSCKTKMSHKIGRFLISIIVGLLLFIVAMKALFPYSEALEVIRYFLLMLWMQGIWPLMFTRIPRLKGIFG